MPKVYQIFDAVANQSPYAFYQTLRDEAPVAELAPMGFIAVSRYADVLRVLRSPAQFSNKGYNAAQPPGSPLLTEFSPSIVQLDPPRHTKLRNIVSRVFTPKMVAQLESRIRATARRLVDDAVSKGQFDLVADISIPLPIAVIAELLGIGDERRADFKRWSDDFLNSLALLQGNQVEQLRGSFRELRTCFLEIIEARQKQPTDDLMSQLVWAEVDGEKLSPDDVVSFACALLIAGNETATALIGSSIVLLTDHPEQLADCIANPELIPNAIEEVLRYESPAQCAFRLALEDVEVAGEVIPEGKVVLALLASANHDERRFPDPARFDIRRDAKGHLAFGFDIHSCLGAPLARLEGRVQLEELFARVKRIERVDQKVSWVRSFLQRAPERLEVVVR